MKISTKILAFIWCTMAMFAMGFNAYLEKVNEVDGLIMLGLMVLIIIEVEKSRDSSNKDNGGTGEG